MVKALPFADITVPSPGFGAMGLSFGLGNNLSLEEAEPLLLKAIELGCTFWDTAVSSKSFETFSQASDTNIVHVGCLSGRR
jgi:predicted aldo/keto reductase-like oxidoreductase